MRTIALLVLSTFLATANIAVAEPSIVSSQTYVCPKCGKVHVRSASPVVAPTTQAAAVTQAGAVIESLPGSAAPSQTRLLQGSGQTSVAARPRLRAFQGVRNVLAALNAQRARQGVASLRYDPQLQAVAQRRAQQMAASGYKSHPPGSFAPGRYEGVGWSSSYSPSGVSACYTSDSRMQFAGAAMATGRDGVYFAVVYR